MSQVTLGFSSVSSQSPILLSAGFLIIWILVEIVQTSIKRPKNLVISKSPTAFNRWLSSMYYLINGPQMQLSNYQNASHSHFAIRAPGHWNIFLKSPEHIKELSQGNEDTLSLHAYSNTLIQPRYSSLGLELNHAINASKRLQTRAFRSLLLPQIPALQGLLQQKIQGAISEELSGSRLRGDWHNVSPVNLALRTVCEMNLLAFFGEEFASHPQHTKVLREYLRDVAATAVVLRFTPGFLAPLMATLITRRRHAYRTMARLITPLVEGRLKRSTSPTDLEDEPRDILQWVINSPPKDYTWTSRQLISSMLSFCLPSTPTALTLSYVLLDLCKHPEFTELLRHQIRELPVDDTFYTRLNRLPALDSFLKESARLSPGNSTAVSRQTLVHYTFSGPDGPHVPAGNWITVPSRAIMRDPANYPSPETFDPFRFATNVIATGETDMEVNAAHVKYTDASYNFPLWGLGKRICPGRFYASIALKLVVAEIVLNYDLKLEDEKGAAKKETFFCFDSFRVPRVTMSMRRKAFNREISSVV